MPLLRNPAPPRLPDPHPDFNLRFVDGLLNVLRLYFEQLFNVLQNLLGARGGTYMRTAYGEFVSLADQVAASPNTEYAVTFTDTHLSEGVSVVSSSRITVDTAGIYEFGFSLQLANNDAAIQTIDTWLKVNGTNHIHSNSRFSVTEQHGGKPGHMATQLIYLMDLAANDYVEFFWSTTDVDAYLDYTAAAAGPTRPDTPSAVATVVFVSAPEPA